MTDRKDQPAQLKRKIERLEALLAETQDKLAQSQRAVHNLIYAKVDAEIALKYIKAEIDNYFGAKNE